MEADLKSVAEDERRSLHATVLVAIESYISERETAAVKADPEALRRLAEAREAVQEGDVVYGIDAAKALVDGRQER